MASHHRYRDGGFLHLHLLWSISLSLSLSLSLSFSLFWWNLYGQLASMTVGSSQVPIQLLGSWVFGFSCREPQLTSQTSCGFWGFYFFNLDFRWLLGVDLVGFVLNCWINARICGLIVASLCLYLVVVDGGWSMFCTPNTWKSFHCKCFIEINRVSKTQFPGGRHVEKRQLRSD